MKSSSKAIVIYRKKILLILRDNIRGIKQPNKWSIPGGMLEKGESHEQALRRELKEEINVVPKNLQYLGSLKFFWLARHAFYLAYLSEKEFKKVKLGKEGQEIKLFGINELNRINLTSGLSKHFRTHRKYLKQIMENNKKVKSELLGLKD